VPQGVVGPGPRGVSPRQRQRRGHEQHRAARGLQVRELPERPKQPLDRWRDHGRTGIRWDRHPNWHLRTELLSVLAPEVRGAEPRTPRKSLTGKAAERRHLLRRPGAAACATGEPVRSSRPAGGCRRPNRPTHRLGSKRPDPVSFQEIGGASAEGAARPHPAGRTCVPAVRRRWRRPTSRRGPPTGRRRLESSVVSIGRQASEGGPAPGGRGLPRDRGVLAPQAWGAAPCRLSGRSGGGRAPP
jgi:hypothetical protein